MNNNIINIHNKEIHYKRKMNFNQNHQMINKNFNIINNENEINVLGNEVTKDNQTEYAEENEIYLEGPQFPNHEVFNDMNNYEQ